MILRRGQKWSGKKWGGEKFLHTFWLRKIWKLIHNCLWNFPNIYINLNFFSTVKIAPEKTWRKVSLFSTINFFINAEKNHFFRIAHLILIYISNNTVAHVLHGNFVYEFSILCMSRVMHACQNNRKMTLRKLIEILDI